jgi:hypothetical protein
MVSPKAGGESIDAEDVKVPKQSSAQVLAKLSSTGHAEVMALDGRRVSSA